MLVHGSGRDQQLIEGCGCPWRLIRKIAPHGRERNKYLADVPAVVTGVLLLGGHYADDVVRERIQVNSFANRIPAGEKLLGRVTAQKRHAARLLLIVPVIEAALAHVEAANVSERRMRPCYGKRCIVVAAVG